MLDMWQLVHGALYDDCYVCLGVQNYKDYDYEVGCGWQQSFGFEKNMITNVVVEMGWRDFWVYFAFASVL